MLYLQKNKNREKSGKERRKRRNDCRNNMERGLSIRISRVLITRNYNYLPAQAAIILGKKFSLNNVSALPFGEFHFLEEKKREKRHENIYIYAKGTRAFRRLHLAATHELTNRLTVFTITTYSLAPRYLSSFRSKLTAE